MRGGAVAFRSGDKAVADMAGFVSAKQGEVIDIVFFYGFQVWSRDIYA